MNHFILFMLCFGAVLSEHDELVHHINEILHLLDAGSGEDEVKPYVSENFTVFDAGYMEIGKEALSLLLDDVIPHTLAHKLNADSVKHVIPDKMVDLHGHFEWDEDNDGRLDVCGFWLARMINEKGEYKLSQIVYSDDNVWGDNDDELCVVDNFPNEKEGKSEEEVEEAEEDKSS